MRMMAVPVPNMPQLQKQNHSPGYSIQKLLLKEPSKIESTANKDEVKRALEFK